jgi:glucose-6-phosphate isomerase
MEESTAMEGTIAQRLAHHRRHLGERPLAAIVATRVLPLLEVAGLSLDLGKSYSDETTFRLLAEQAERAALSDRVEALFNGQSVNTTEGRPALHTALRATAADAPMQAEVAAVLARMRQLVEALHAGAAKGFDDRAICDVVHVGIGGSDLGPRMVTTALRHWWRGPVRVHFVANIDPDELADTLAPLQPATTLVIIASKSFSTPETLANGEAARAWLQAAAGDRDLGPQLVAISANVEAARRFGVPEAQVYPMWDWVGGRYSLWSAIGLPIAIAVGWDHFRQLLDGARQMDEHYRQAPLAANMPALLALLECWYIEHWNAHSIAVLPYSHRLRLLPDFLQQLSMESLGKSVTMRGQPLQGHSGAVIWGSAGSNCQHSYMQLVHQGTRFIPVDFIAVRRGESDDPRHAQLYANCLSQSRALLTGKSAAEVEAELIDQGLDAEAIAALLPHKVLPGNRPSNTLLLDELNPSTLGALVALYEHKVHAQGVLWQINAFDQWGVELGKQAASRILPRLRGHRDDAFDPSTEQLIAHFLEQVTPNGST